MKTIHTISAALALTISSISSAETAQPQVTNSLTVSIVEVINPTCNGIANGSVTVEALGGKAPYTYNWNTFPAQNTATAINLKKGVYFVEVRDAEGAVYFRSVELTDPVQTTVNYTSSVATENQVVRVGLNTNTSDMQYAFFLDGQQIKDPVLSDLDVGIHQLVITDNQSCTVIQYIQVFEMENETSAITEQPKSDINLTPIITLERAEEQFLTYTMK